MTLKLFLKNNSIVIGYFFLAIIIEVYGIYFTNCKPIIYKPFYLLLLLSLICYIQIITRHKIIQLAISTIMLLLQILLITGFIFLFESNGQYFQWSMLNQRTDAYGTIEVIALQYKFLIVALLLLGLFLVRFIKYIRINKRNNNLKNKPYIFSTKINILILNTILFTFIIIPVINSSKININYKEIVREERVNSYQEQGITSAVIYELLKGETFKKFHANNYNSEGVEDFIYQEKTDKSEYFGISKDNNLIMILLESFEWYAFAENEYSDEINEKLFPNLTYLYNNSIKSTSFYAREKTDVSEALSLLGNYPVGDDVHYGFAENSFPYSLPNMMKRTYKDIVINSFHSNSHKYYNRNVLHKSLGFDKYYGIEDMVEYGVSNVQETLKERNLDSSAFEHMKEIMFPIDERFFTYYLTYTTHGFYGERESLKEYYDKIDRLGVFPKTGEVMDEYLRTYAATVMDTDKALGYMLDYLRENNMLDKTSIVLYSDHNTYYNNLSYYAKDIDEKFNSELYRIPFMIYDEKLVEEFKNNNPTNLNLEISKFTTTTDILPTVLDLFGIEGWKNLYFGSSMFLKDKESIIYSRSYGVFVTNKLIGYSIYDLLYLSDDLLESEENYQNYINNDFIPRSEIHLEKLEYFNKIYYTNYFSEYNYLP